MPEILYGEPSREKSYHLEENVFNEGPEDDNHQTDPDFPEKRVEEKLRLWHEYLCKNLARMSDTQIHNAWKATGTNVILPAFVGIRDVVVKGGRKAPISRADYARGPADAQGRHQQYFDQLPTAQQAAEWAKADESSVPALPKAVIAEANNRAAMHQTGMDTIMSHIERFSTDGVVDTGWSKKAHLGLGVGIGSAIFAVLGTLASVGSWYFTQKQTPPSNNPPSNSPPDTPGSVTATAYGPSVTVSWNPPSTGGADCYQLTLIDQNSHAQTTVSDIPTLMFIMPDLANSTYIAQVVAVNANGNSTAAASAPVVTPGAATLDLNAEVDQSALSEALSTFQNTTALSHDAFWDNVIPICTVDENNNPIGYDDQLKLAYYLAMVLLDPVPPDTSRLGQYAAQICKNANPSFPARPSQPGDGWIDPKPLWTSASRLQNQLQTTVLPVRTQLCGLIRCLEVYLGTDPGSMSYV